MFAVPTFIAQPLYPDVGRGLARSLLKLAGAVTPQNSKQRENKFPFSKNENQQKNFSYIECYA